MNQLECTGKYWMLATTGLSQFCHFRDLALPFCVSLVMFQTGWCLSIMPCSSLVNQLECTKRHWMLMNKWLLPVVSLRDLALPVCVLTVVFHTVRCISTRPWVSLVNQLSCTRNYWMLGSTGLSQLRDLALPVCVSPVVFHTGRCIGIIPYALLVNQF